MGVFGMLHTAHLFKHAAIHISVGTTNRRIQHKVSQIEGVGERDNLRTDLVE